MSTPSHNQKLSERTSALRNFVVVTTLVIVGALAALPLVSNMVSGDTGDRRVGKVELTCFDQQMRAHPCEVKSTTVAAQIARTGK